MKKYKELSYNAKSLIFLLANLAVIIVGWGTGTHWLLMLSDVLWGVGVFYWGASYAQRKARKEHEVEIFGKQDSVVG